MRDDHSLEKIVVTIEACRWHVPENRTVNSDRAIQFLRLGPKEIIGRITQQSSAMWIRAHENSLDIVAFDHATHLDDRRL
jgi:hypothetical protein